MKHRLLYPCLMLLPLLTAACGDANIKESIGLARTAPDEFTVVSRPSLVTPPEFTLRPPVPGAPPRAPSANETARGLLTGTTPGSAEDAAPAPKGAASQLLKRAGADKAQDDIRQQLGTDAQTPADTSKARSLLERVTGADKADPVVDAKKEAERLRKNKDTGKPANDGDVAVEKPKTPSLLDRIF